MGIRACNRINFRPLCGGDGRLLCRSASTIGSAGHRPAPLVPSGRVGPPKPRFAQPARRRSQIGQKPILLQALERGLGRRQLLERGAVAAGALWALGMERVLGSNEKIGLGLIGSGGRGRRLLEHFQKEPRVEFRAICDVYEPHRKLGVAAASPTAAPYLDYREVLSRSDIDAVIIATPDHWHARMVIDAAEAGKDAYVEKPLCHTIEEGFQVVEAVRRTRRVVQVGTQRRSYPLFIEGKKVLSGANLGPVRLVTAWWLNQQTSVGREPLTGKLDWERWLGPAPRRPLDELRFRNWYYFWDYSGGLMVGQAAHIVDAINWLMGSSYPLAVTTSAGRVHLDGVEVPETTSMSIEYPEDYLAVFTVGYRAMRYPSPRDQLVQFHGLRARFDIGRESFALHPESMDRNAKPSVEREAYDTFPQATDAHVANFLQCCRSRDDPSAPVEAGHHANVALCMAMESLKKGRRIRWSAEKRAMET